MIKWSMPLKGGRTCTIIVDSDNVFQEDIFDIKVVIDLFVPVLPIMPEEVKANKNSKQPGD